MLSQSNHRLLQRNRLMVRDDNSPSRQQYVIEQSTIKKVDEEEENMQWVEWWNEVKAQLQGTLQQRSSMKALSFNIETLNQRIQPLSKKVDEFPSPMISARSWVIMNGQTGRMIWGKNEHNRKEVASLTKIMTCYITVLLLEKLKMDPTQTYVQVSSYAAQVGGTSAGLKEGDILLVHDLLYGMMLPSGNDAATVLAENFGVYFYFQSKEFALKFGNQENISNLRIQSPGRYFVQEMNETAIKLGLLDTQYGNPHGLSNKLSKSSSYDVAKLSFAAMKFPYFQQIVNQKQYSCKILNEGLWRECIWENTNKLLDHGFSGIKTGVTNEAGPCLASLFKSKTNSYIVVILNSSHKEERWLDTCKIVDWVTQIYEH